MASITKYPTSASVVMKTDGGYEWTNAGGACVYDSDYAAIIEPGLFGGGAVRDCSVIFGNSGAYNFPPSQNGDDKSDGGLWSASEETKVYGSDVDNWNIDFGPAGLNIIDSDFSLYISVSNNDNSLRTHYLKLYNFGFSGFTDYIAFDGVEVNITRFVNYDAEEGLYAPYINVVYVTLYYHEAPWTNQINSINQLFNSSIFS